jgi:hypothetical protein
MAERILSFAPHVLAVQEVEDIDALNEFGKNFLEQAYPHQVLVEGNDPRLIDVGIYSKLTIGAVVSWTHLVHPDQPDERYSVETCSAPTSCHLTGHENCSRSTTRI